MEITSDKVHEFQSQSLLEFLQSPMRLLFRSMEVPLKKWTGIRTGESMQTMKNERLETPAGGHRESVTNKNINRDETREMLPITSSMRRVCGWYHTDVINNVLADFARVPTDLAGYNLKLPIQISQGSQLTWQATIYNCQH